MNEHDGYRGLRYEFRLRAPQDPAVEAYVADLLAAQRGPVDAPDTFTIRATGDPGAFAYELVLGSERWASAPRPEGLVTPLVQQVNARAVDTWDAGPVCHAGAVEHDGMAVVFPADQESGKTTLVTALVQAGFGYLTDEAAAFDQTAQVVPFPKPLSIDPGSWPLFPHLQPHADLPTTQYRDQQWQVAPDDIRAGAVGHRSSAAWIVFPNYERGRPTVLQPIGRGEALMELTRHTFGFAERSRVRLDELAAIVQGASCHRLTVGSLEEACRLITSLVGAPAVGLAASS
ncbi:MAG: hypothetical protein ABWZ76_07215 [Acidimicrobiales bacterium]